MTRSKRENGYWIERTNFLLCEGSMSTPTDDTPTDAIATGRHAAPPRPPIPRFLRAFALPIILIWIVIVALLNTVVPQLEVVGKMRAVSMSPNDARR